MFGSTHTRIAAGIASGLATTALFATAAAAAGKPAGMTQQAYAALEVRSEALNKTYGLGKYASLSRDEALNARYGNEWTKLSAAEFKTVIDLFGSEVTQMPLSEVQAAVDRRLALDGQRRAAEVTSVTRSNGFDWGDSAIGAAATVGVLLLGSAGAIAVRRRGGATTLANRHSHA